MGDMERSKERAKQQTKLEKEYKLDKMDKLDMEDFTKIRAGMGTMMLDSKIVTFAEEVRWCHHIT